VRVFECSFWIAHQFLLAQYHTHISSPPSLHTFHLHRLQQSYPFFCLCDVIAFCASMNPNPTMFPTLPTDELQSAMENVDTMMHRFPKNPHTRSVPDRDIINPKDSVETNLRLMHTSVFSILDVVQHLKENRVAYRDVKDKCLYLQREFIFLTSQQDSMTAAQTKRYRHLSDLLERIDAYVSGKDAEVLNSHMKILTYITAILTPLGVIVGYFGMNFNDMGAPANGTGVFSLRHGHLIVFVFMVLIVAFMTYMYYVVLP